MRAYNRWAEEMRETSGGVVLAAGPVPLNDIGRAVEEVRYGYEHLGVKSFWARPNQFNHRNLGDRYYEERLEILRRDPRPSWGLSTSSRQAGCRWPNRSQ